MYIVGLLQVVCGGPDGSVLTGLPIAENGATPEAKMAQFERCEISGRDTQGITESICDLQIRYDAGTERTVSRK